MSKPPCQRAVQKLCGMHFCTNARRHQYELFNDGSGLCYLDATSAAQASSANRLSNDPLPKIWMRMAAADYRFNKDDKWRVFVTPYVAAGRKRTGWNGMEWNGMEMDRMDGMEWTIWMEGRVLMVLLTLQ